MKFKSIAPFLLTVLVCSCSATLPVKKEPVKAPPSAQQELHAAETSARNGDNKKAIARLKRILQQYGDSDVADDALMLMGQIHQSQQLPLDALNDYVSILNLEHASPLDSEAALRAARLQLKLSQPSEAERSLERASHGKTLSAAQLAEIDKLRYESFLGQKKNLQALEQLVVLHEHAVQASERESYKAVGRELIDTRLTEDEVREASDSRRYGLFQPYAMFRYALMLMDQRQFSRAQSYLSDVISAAPGTDFAEKAAQLISQLDSRNKVDPRTIGVVLPLSGKQAPIGYKALKAIQLGLGIYGRGSPSGFRLAVIDSEGNPDAARRAVERLVQEDSVIAIIGGLLSKTATAEASKAQAFGLPAIMLSQKAGVTQAGDYVFRNALTSQMQIQYLVDYAITRMGMRNFAVLYPNDAYGVEYADLFWNEVRSRGGNITGAQPYDPSETDFRGYVQRLVGTFYLEDRADEYRLRAKAWADKNQKRSSRAAPPSVEDLLPPIVDFDAVFIPDNVKAIGQIAPMLAYNNVTGVRLLGTNLWNSPSLVTRGQKFVEGSVFVDSFLATDPAFTGSDFFAGFKATFEEEPGLTEVQAYDSALILRQLIAGGETTRPGLRAKMASLQNFPGALGRLSVNDDREFRRPIVALTVKDAHVIGADIIRK